MTQIEKGEGGTYVETEKGWGRKRNRDRNRKGGGGEKQGQ